MKIKLAKENQRSNCRYCKAEGSKVPSVWHLTFENIQACDKHKHILQEIKSRADKEDREYSEADYQTWLRY